MAYQSFDDRAGGSKSAEKLAGLRLPKSFRGKRVLDLGCNEGFFCFEAKRRGAARVVGVDRSRKFIDAARQRAAAEKLDVEFQVGHFRTARGEFDYIFFLSAIHYAENPKAILRHVSRLLAPDGLLILECGVVGGYGHMMRRALRAIDERYFPTLELLRDDWLEDFAVRVVGPSVKQAGDPVPRQVFHCSKRKPTVVFISGEGKIGKSTLARRFATPLLISTDSILAPVRNKMRPKVTKEQAAMDQALARYENNIAEAWASVRSNRDVVRYFAEVVSKMISLNKMRDIIVVEGYSASDLAPIVMNKFKDEVLFWNLEQEAPQSRRSLWGARETGDVAAVGEEGLSVDEFAGQESEGMNPKPGLFSRLGTRLRS